MATIYRYNDYEYRDEDGAFTTDEVKKQLTQYYPELANAKAETSAEGEDTVITFVKRAGTKGVASVTGGASRTEDDVDPLPDVELFKLEYEVRAARNGGRRVEMDADTALSLIGEAWYLRTLLEETPNHEDPKGDGPDAG
jgi:PRTRC genetic system protein C